MCGRGTGDGGDCEGQMRAIRRTQRPFQSCGGGCAASSAGVDTSEITGGGLRFPQLVL